MWISLPSLPLNFFKKNFLEVLTKPIGRVLAYDQATLSFSRPRVARVCVEVNLLPCNPSRIWLDMRDKGARWQRILYKRNKQYCKACRKQGHGEEECRKMKVHVKSEEAKGMDLLSKEEEVNKAISGSTKGKLGQQNIENVGQRKFSPQSKHPNIAQQAKSV